MDCIRKIGELNERLFNDACKVGDLGGFCELRVILSVVDAVGELLEAVTGSAERGFDVLETISKVSGDCLLRIGQVLFEGDHARAHQFEL